MRAYYKQTESKRRKDGKKAIATASKQHKRESSRLKRVKCRN